MSLLEKIWKEIESATSIYIVDYNWSKQFFQMSFSFFFLWFTGSSAHYAQQCLFLQHQQHWYTSTQENFERASLALSWYRLLSGYWSGKWLDMWGKLHVDIEVFGFDFACILEWGIMWRGYMYIKYIQAWLPIEMNKWGTAKLYGSDSISFIQCSGIQTAMRSSISMTVFNPITVGIKDQQISKDQGYINKWL